MLVHLTKAFSTVNHQILLKKLKYYGILGTNLRRFENYLKNRKQFISLEHDSTKNAAVICGFPQGSILGPSLILLHVNDLHHASKVLNPILFADDTNHISHSDINVLFKNMNKELTNVSSLFNANKLSLNVEKKQVFFLPQIIKKV